MLGLIKCYARSDLASVPEDLRGCLERCLSEEASPAVLEQHLPQVRTIVIRLLQGLKIKQAEYKRILVARQSRTSSDQQAPSQDSSASRAAGAALQSEMFPKPQRANRISRPLGQRTATPPTAIQPSQDAIKEEAPAGDQPKASLATESIQKEPAEAPSDAPRAVISTLTSSSEPPAASEAADASIAESEPIMRTASVSPRDSRVPQRFGSSASMSRISTSRSGTDGVEGGFAPSLNVTEADPSLRALKSRDALERRASKRFSAYTFNKMGVGQGFGQSFGSGNVALLGSSPTVDKRDGHKRMGSRRQKPSVSDIEEHLPPLPKSPMAGSRSGPSSPSGKSEGGTLEEMAESPRQRAIRGKKLGVELSAPDAKSGSSPTPSKPATSSVESLPFADATQPPLSPMKASQDLHGGNVETSTSNRAPKASTPIVESVTLPDTDLTKAQIQAPALQGMPDGFGATDPTNSSTEGHGEINIFLQLGRQTRKASLERGSEISIARLRMLFVDRFAYSPGKDDFPTIYIKDPSSGVSYELEDLHDVAEGCLLTLSIEPLDQVKQHLDLTLGVITRELREVKQALSDREQREASVIANAVAATHQQHQALAVPVRSPEINLGGNKFSDREFAAAGQRVASFKQASPRPGDDEGDHSRRAPSADSGAEAAFGLRMAQDLKDQYDEVVALRREMAILRQLQGDFSTDVGGLLKRMKEQSSKVRSIAATEVSAERNFIIAGKSRLDTSSQEVLTSIEDLQDLVDDLKLDVIQRGVKPKPATLKKIAADISHATRGLEDLEKYVQTVKPTWKKTWEAELQNIVDEQEFLNHQEGLIADLRDDHVALQDVYENIQQVVKLRGAGRASAGGPAGGAPGSRFVPPLPEEGHEGLSTVMLEVRGQHIDHERRLRAVQAAEKSRQREMLSRTDEFTEELAGFVTGRSREGGLRKTGGHLEAERIRAKRDKATLLAMFGAGGSGGAPVDMPLDKPKRLVLGSGARGTGRPGSGGGASRSERVDQGSGSTSISSSTEKVAQTSGRSSLDRGDAPVNRPPAS